LKEFPQTGRNIERKGDRQTDRQTGRNIDRKGGRQTDRLAER
jgi:hypothetical protein